MLQNGNRCTASAHAGEFVLHMLDPRVHPLVDLDKQAF